MTWGQLRLQLQLSASGVTLDLLDEFLNTRYEAVLESTDWTGLDATATIQTTAAYQSTVNGSDTVTWTTGSSTVTGTGTWWTTALIGRRIYRPGDEAMYTVIGVPSNNAITLDRAYEGIGTEAAGTAYSAAAYVVMQNIYPLPSDLATLADDSLIDPVTNFPMQRMSKAELDRSAGVRTLVANPVSFALYDDTAETSPPVLHQIEFYPPPLYARGITLHYRRAALGFDGQNTGAAPLPWVSTTVLMHGCRADIAAYLAAQTPASASVYLAQATMYEMKFAEELGRMLRVEFQQRRKRPVVRMASRFTRHRLERAARGMNSYPFFGPGDQQS